MKGFTKNELETIRIALDMLVRNEANSLAQAGIGGLRAGKAEVLGKRLKHAVTSLEKIEERIKELPPPEPPEVVERPAPVAVQKRAGRP